MTKQRILALRKNGAGEAETSHLLMHRQHQEWLTEDGLWRDEIAIWQKELKAALRQAATVEKSLRKLDDALRVHAAAIRCYEDDMTAHEHALAEFERGGKGEDLLPLVDAHRKESRKHAQQRESHQRHKQRVHAALASWNLLVKSLETA